MMVDNNFQINNKTNRRCDINKTGNEIVANFDLQYF